MFVDYEVIQKIEVLNEVGAGVLADFSRQLETMNISIEERENPIIILYWQIVRLKNNFIKMNTIEELKDAQAQLNFVSQYIKKLRDCNKGVEGMELPPLAESLGEITREEGIKAIKEKYNLKENADES